MKTKGCQDDQRSKNHKQQTGAIETSQDFRKRSRCLLKDVLFLVETRVAPYLI